MPLLGHWPGCSGNADRPAGLCLRCSPRIPAQVYSACCPCREKQSLQFPVSSLAIKTRRQDFSRSRCLMFCHYFCSLLPVTTECAYSGRALKAHGCPCPGGLREPEFSEPPIQLSPGHPRTQRLACPQNAIFHSATECILSRNLSVSHLIYLLIGFSIYIL